MHVTLSRHEHWIETCAINHDSIPGVPGSPGSPSCPLGPGNPFSATVRPGSPLAPAWWQTEGKTGASSSNAASSLHLPAIYSSPASLNGLLPFLTTKSKIKLNWNSYQVHQGHRVCLRRLGLPSLLEVLEVQSQGTLGDPCPLEVRKDLAHQGVLVLLSPAESPVKHSHKYIVF